MPLPRVCQFFLRGRCQRGEKCDFSHVMPTNASSATATTANGSKEVGQPINSSTIKTSLLPGEKETFITPKVPLPDPKGNPDSDDESIMRKGGDSDDDTESVGSGFTSIAPEKPESSTLPPTSNIAPKENVPSVGGTDEPKISDNVENRVDNTTFDTASKVDDTQGTSSLTESIAPIDNTSISTTINDENPPLVRQANKILVGKEDKTAASKDEPKKEIRRDSKGFEKFEDYFDSSFDDTTLKSNNVTAANDTNVEQQSSKKEQEENSEKSPENISEKEKELEKDTSSVQVLAEVASKSSESIAASSSASSKSQDLEMVEEPLSSSTQKEASEQTSVLEASESLPEKRIQKDKSEAHNGDSDVNSEQQSVKEIEEKSDTLANAHEDKETLDSDKQTKSVVTVRQQPVVNVEKRQQISTTNTTSKPADLSKDWDMDEDEADAEDDSQESNNVTEKDTDTTNKIDTKEDNNEVDTAAETIENIESFIQEEPKDTSTPAVHKSKSMASINTKPSLSQHEARIGEKRKLERTVGKRTEEWVTMIFGEDGKQVDGKAAAAAKNQKKSVYDLNPDEEEFSIDEKTPFTTKASIKTEISKETPKSRKDVLSKRSGVTKIGNNTYYYTGPKGESTGDSQDEEGGDEEEIGHVDDGEDDDDDMEEEPQGAISGGTEEPWTADDEEDDGDSSIATPKKRKVASKSYDSGRKKHNTTYVYGARSTAAKTRRCGECEGCNREDCGKCVTCLDKPKFGGKNSKKQACIYRMCAWKNPSGKRIKPGSAPVAAPPTVPDATTSPAPVRTLAMVAAARERENNVRGANNEDSATQKGTKRGRKSISVISPASVSKDLKKGSQPPVVKKGEDEYNVVVSGVKDTGLCGKYWSDLENLPPRRRCTLNDPKPEVVQGPAGVPAKTRKIGDSPASDCDKPRSSGRGRPSKTARKQNLTQEEIRQEPEDDGQEDSKNKSFKGGRGKRKLNDDKESNVSENGESSNANKSVNDSSSSTSLGIKPAANEDNIQNKRPSGNIRLVDGNSQWSMVTSPSGNETRPDEMGSTGEPGDKDHETVNNTATKSIGELNGGTSVSRNVSCVADTKSEREVVVECFAPYDDHRWVNIGKERDGMSPDAVQYARALRPPYHLLSFLRIKGKSTKGMSCTDKNTMVFVVLEGEINVVLHTTSFNAKKGDSFYIPPKNYYNLINQNAREAELSLIQFQYDGPLPTVAAGSQSGMVKPPTATTQATASTSNNSDATTNETK